MENQDNSTSGPQDHAHGGAAEDERGHYVEGQYGAAGTEDSEGKADPEGQYPEGDYGSTGAVDSNGGDGGGSFVQADYGQAGEVPGTSPSEPQGSYVDKDLDAEDGRAGGN